MPSMTHKQVVNRQLDITEEIERLEAKDTLNQADEDYFRELTDEFEALDTERKGLERKAKADQIRKSEVFANLKNPRARFTGSDPDDAPSTDDDGAQVRRFNDPYDISEVRVGLTPDERGSELHARALTAIERMTAADDSRKQAATKILERWDTRDGKIAELVLAASSDVYVRAFGKLIQNQGQMQALTVTEQAAVQRAMSTTPADGGFLIPFQLDPSVINTADGSFNQVRQIARQVIATGNEWHGITSSGVTSRWAGEATETDDNSPTLAQPGIPVHKIDVFVPISIEGLQDATNVASEVGQMVAFEKDRRESVAFVTGTGTGQPTGIVTALTGTASVVESGAANTFATGDVYALDEALPARYRQRASYLANRVTQNDIRQFGGDVLWEPSLQADAPPRLIGRGVYEAEEMASGTADNTAILAFGDFQNYVIADRLGTTVEFIPHLFGASGRPTGQRGWYAYARVGADSVNDGAFRLLTVQAAGGV